MSSVRAVCDPYVTMLGTCFYGRVYEERELLNMLDPELSEGGRTIIVTGPRGAGKSELIRFISWRHLDRSNLLVLSFNARAGRAAQLLEGMRVYGGLRRAAREATRSLAETIAGELSTLLSPMPQARLAAILSSVYQVLAKLEAAARESLADRVYIVVDEFHRLHGVAGFRDSLEDLEDIAALLSKDRVGYGRYVLLVTTSEGFIQVGSSRDRLRGYNVAYLLVEEMDAESFRELYREFCSKRKTGCTVPLEYVEKLAGRLPGYLRELEDAGRGARLESLVGEWIARFIETLEDLAESSGEQVRQIAAAISEAFKAEKPYSEYGLKPCHVEELARRNIAYLDASWRAVKPQLRVYMMVAKLISEGVSVSELTARRVLEYASLG